MGVGISHDLLPHPYIAVDAFTSPTPSPGSTNVEAIGGSVVGVVVVIAIVFVVVLVLGKRDRIRAKLWRPQSPGEGGDHTSPSRDRLRSTTGTITSVNGRYVCLFMCPSHCPHVPLPLFMCPPTIPCTTPML